MKIGKRMKRILDVMGSQYQTKVIDGELCVYRDLGNGIEFEVSGVSRPEPGSICSFVCVWKVWPIQHGDTHRIVGRSIEYVRWPRTLDELKAVLEGLTEKYSGPNPPTVDADSCAQDWLQQNTA